MKHLQLPLWPFLVRSKIVYSPVKRGYEEVGFAFTAMHWSHDGTYLKGFIGETERQVEHAMEQDEKKWQESNA